MRGVYRLLRRHERGPPILFAIRLRTTGIHPSRLISELARQATEWILAIVLPERPARVRADGDCLDHLAAGFLYAHVSQR
ncbi:unnamed protein product [Tuber aestivum]|uniref:Uncharacterized protein n=1 Tax=Tuber aestivum TaxID=59557 RepID=A0A292PK75_9PEZI|nr:unnamed protein product [Tuber aestivum]